MFKFDRIQFVEGEIGFQAGTVGYLFGALILLLVAALCLLYLRTHIYGSPRVRTVSLGLRLAALGFLCLPLFEPVLVTPSVVPDENFVAVLVDDSESMSLPDGSLGETRADDAHALLFDKDRGIMDDIRADFNVRLYTFSDDAARTDSLTALGYGQKTNLTAGLDRVMTDFRGLPLTGIVMLTDGGDNSGEVPRNAAEKLRSQGIGLHIVGLGEEEMDEEREILDVVVSKGIGQTAGTEIEVRVRSWATESAPVTFTIYDGDVPVFSEDRMLKGEGKIDQLAFFFEQQEETAHVYRIEIEQTAGELNAANNALPLLVDAELDTLRVLYFEGHLRQDFKFIKRALQEDVVVEFTSITRTGTGKLYRQGIRTPEELAGGFPTQPQDLYPFKAVIFGDVEASTFTPEQLRLLEEFVRVRGGGFLMMGGRNTFAEGNYIRTPVADMLPVELDPSRSQVLPRRFTNPTRISEEEEGFVFVPTAAGLESSILRFSPDPAVNRSRWAALPRLTSINYLGPVKPGAQVLAEKPDDQYGEREPLLVVQRYGKGRTMAMATSSTWRWQMLREADDYSHERFWQQLARWLAASAPNRVNIDMGQAHITPGGEIPVLVNVFDADYQPLGGIRVTGQLTDPAGSIQEVQLDEELATDGRYTATLAGNREGIYTLDVVAEDETNVIGHHRRSFLATPSQREFYDATQKRALLEELATFYYTPEEAATIPLNLRGRRSSTSIFHTEYLWDMPLLFVLAAGLLCCEWVYRRRKGLR